MAARTTSLIIALSPQTFSLAGQTVATVQCESNLDIETEFQLRFNSCCVVSLNSYIVIVLKSLINTTAAQVYLQTFWMKAFGAKTPKRTVVYSNTPQIKMLDSGKMTRSSLSSDIKTTRAYVSKDGKKRFAGNENLKGTQFPGMSKTVIMMLSSYCDIVWALSSNELLTKCYTTCWA